MVQDRGRGVPCSTVPALGAKDTIADYWLPTRYNEFAAEKLVSRKQRARANQSGMACGVPSEAGVEYVRLRLASPPHAELSQNGRDLGDVCARNRSDGPRRIGRNGKREFYVADGHDSPMKQSRIFAEARSLPPE